MRKRSNRSPINQVKSTIPEQSVLSLSPPEIEFKLKVLQAQLAYFTSHLSLADSKAAGVTVFASTIAGITAAKIHWMGISTLHSKSVLGLSGLIFCLITTLFSFSAIWPRTRPTNNVFSWMGVSLSSQQHMSHSQRILSVTDYEVLEGLAHTTESLAISIRRKYASIRTASFFLVPATLSHIAFWILS